MLPPQEWGRDEEWLNSLVSLSLALEADSWVLHMSSNWCRLVDELRSTVRCKASGLLIDPERQLADFDTNW